MIERTFAMIKPDAVKAAAEDKIVDIIEKNGFTIVEMRKEHLTRDKAAQFYAVHSSRSFFNELIDFMTSGPVVLMVLQKKNAVQAWRDLMGATDPKKAEPKTIRALFGSNIGENATHGSDSQETAKQEIALMFPGL
ncbi:MAG: nucleoside-diphosphate kinase [Candidatus Babeliales bacterium]